MDRLPYQFPGAVHFLQHPYFMGIRFHAVFGGRHLFVAHPGIIAMNAHFVIGIDGTATVAHFYAGVFHQGRRNIVGFALRRGNQDAAVRLNMPAIGMRGEIAGAPGGGFFFEELLDGG